MSTRKMNVIDATEVHTGTSASGVDWSLYEITATTEDGEPIDLKLKSFDKLDGLVEVEVERQEHETYGVSYMLRLPKGSGGGGGTSAGARLGPKVDELRDRVERLESLVGPLRSEIEGLKVIAYERTGVGEPVAASVPAIDPGDIPF